jgi:hypothetical protein
MTRQLAWIFILMTAIGAATGLFAQQKRPYNDLMKDVAAT